MKVTRRQLRKLIIETMITPSTYIIKQILDDPEVDENIKVLLRSDEEESINQAMILMTMLYPDKYGTIDTDLGGDIGGHISTSAYEREFNYTQNQHILDSYTAEFETWLRQSLTDLPDDFLEVFEAAIAYYFDAHAFHMGMYNTVAEEVFSIDFWSHRYPLYEMIVENFIETQGLTDDDNGTIHMGLYEILSELVNNGTVDLEDGVAAAMDSLRGSNHLYYDDENYLLMFSETNDWFAKHPKYDGY